MGEKEAFVFFYYRSINSCVCPGVSFFRKRTLNFNSPIFRLCSKSCQQTTPFCVDSALGTLCPTWRFTSFVRGSPVSLSWCFLVAFCLPCLLVARRWIRHGAFGYSCPDHIFCFLWFVLLGPCPLLCHVRHWTFAFRVLVTRASDGQRNIPDLFFLV